LHLTAYRSHHNTVTVALVLRCKDNNDREVFRFLASELAACVKDAKVSLPHDAVVTFVPRRRAAVQATGHDHAKQLAMALAHELNLPFDTLLRRRILTRQQKELDAVAREKNAAHSFEVVDGSRIKGRTVLLIDDVCTTGASLAACTALLMAAQAERVICAVVAQTEQEK
jgi:ComF family protein